MSLYKCRISDKDGKIRNATMNASSEAMLAQTIMDEGSFLISLQEISGSHGKKRYSTKNVLDFTDTMALLVESGLSVKDSLSISKNIFTKRSMLQLVGTLSDSLTKGNTLYHAMNALGETFPPLYKGLIKIGERAGSLEEIFTRLSTYLKNEKKIKEKLNGALIYPLIVLSVTILGVIGVVTVIFPRLETMFSQIGTNMPDDFTHSMDVFSTTILVGVLLVCLVFGFIGFLQISSKTGGRYAVLSDKIRINIPILGKISIIRDSLNLSFAMEVLLSCGFPMESALQEASSVLTNRALKADLLSIKEKILKGERLSKGFLENKRFPSKIGIWIGIGESSGNVEKVFSQLKIYYQGEMDNYTSILMSLIEPVLILTVGVIVLIVVILFILPLFSMFGAIV